MRRGKKESQPLPEPAAVEIPRLLNECQNSQASHPRAIKQLAECRKIDLVGFLEVWKRSIMPMFLVSKRETAVELIMNLAACFTAHWDEELARDCEKFFESFMSTLLDWTEASSNSVRFRACQMISVVVSKLDLQMEMKEELWDRMTMSMQTRMRDKQTHVRVFAASALSRLVIADDIENDVTVQAYRRALAADPSAEVRKMVIKSMPAANATVCDFVQRVADVSESVRKASFRSIGEKLPASALSITQRVTIIERGLAERVPAVREECEKLLELWLRDCDSDPLRLLRYLDVETNEKVGETVIIELLSKNLIKLNDDGLRNFLDTSGNEQLQMSPEEALFWRVVCTHIHSEAKANGSQAANTGGAEAAVKAAAAVEQNEDLDNILPPTVSDFVQLVENHLHKGSVAWFAARQLLLIAKLMDFTDSTSRKDAGLLLQRLLRDIAPSDEPSESEERRESDDLTSHDWVGDGVSLGGEESWANAVAAFARHVHASVGEFEEVLAAAVDDVGRPCREGGADERQWLHCLAVTGLLLEHITSLDVLAGRAIEPEEIIHSLLLPAVKHLHPEVRRAGVRCLGMFCTVERSPSPRAVKHLRICLQCGRPQVQKMALKAMFDIILCHGAPAIDLASSVPPDLDLPAQLPDSAGRQTQQVEHSEERASGLPILQLLEGCLRGEILVEDSQDQTEYINSVIGIAAEGFVKVLLQNKRFPDVRQMQERIVEELLLLYYKDSIILSPRLKQCLAVFFRIWCSLSAANKMGVLFAESIVGRLIMLHVPIGPQRSIAAVFIPVMRKKWPGIDEKREKQGTVLVARKHATQIAHFMLHLLHLPLLRKANQGADQETADRGDGGAVCFERVSSAPRHEEALDEGLETLGVQICVEVKAQARKFKSLPMARRTYIAMLCRVVTLLRFSPAQQEKIKALTCSISKVMDWLPTTEKAPSKALGDTLASLKEMDETPDKGLTDEELERFMTRMGLHGILKEDSGSDSSTPEPTPRPGSVSRTRGSSRGASSASRAVAAASIPPSTRSLRSRTELQSARSRRGVTQAVTRNMTRKNLSSVYESSSDESDASTISSASDFEAE